MSMRIEQAIQQELQTVDKMAKQLNFKVVFVAINQLLKVYGKHWLIFNYLAEIYFKLDQLNESVKYFRISLSLNANQPKVINQLANIYIKQGKDKLAEQYLLTLFAMQPLFEQLATKLSRLYLKANDKENAFNIFDKVISIDKKNIQAIIGKAQLYFELGNIDKSIELLEKYFNEGVFDAISIKLQAICYQHCDESSKAVQILEKGLDKFPEDKKLYIALANAYTSECQLDNAIASLKLGLEKLPFDEELNSKYVDYLWESGSENVFTYFNQLPVNKVPLNLKLIVFYKMLRSEHFTMAEQLLTSIDESSASIASVVVAKSEYYYINKHFGKIIELVNTIKRSRQLTIYEIQWLIRAYIATGSFANAENLIISLIKNDPDNQGLWCLLATVLKDSDITRYKKLIDLEWLVFQRDLAPPDRYETIGDFNQALVEQLEQLHLMERQPIEQSLVGGTQTVGRIFDHKSDVLASLKHLLVSNIESMLRTLSFDKDHPTRRYADSDFDFSGAWSVKLHANGYHKNHFHERGWYSGVYYVQTPNFIGEKNEGCLKLGEPDIECFNKQNPDLFVHSKAGRLVLFPSFLWHGTVPFQADSSRITIAFDIIPKKK